MFEYVWLVSYTIGEDEGSTPLGVFPELIPRTVEVCRQFVQSLDLPAVTVVAWESHVHRYYESEFGTPVELTQHLIDVKARKVLASLSFKRMPFGRIFD